MKGKKFVIFGDSVQRHFARMINVMMNARNDTPLFEATTAKYTEYYNCSQALERSRCSSPKQYCAEVFQPFCGPGKTIVTATYVPSPFLNFPCPFSAWIKGVVTNDTVLVLNTGPHFSASVLSELPRVLNAVRRHAPRAIVFWRTTPEAIAPQNFSLVPRRCAEYIGYDAHPSYHHTDFKLQNEQIKKLLWNDFPWVLLLDVVYMSGFRSDAMRDYLHPLTGSHLEWWVVVLFHALLILKDLQVL
jgi:hypothetical protein